MIDDLVLPYMVCVCVYVCMCVCVYVCVCVCVCVCVFRTIALDGFFILSYYTFMETKKQVIHTL
jgi:hypothetical protein